MMRMDLDDFGQSVHDIATNYIDTDLEVSGSSFKETAIEGNKQTNNVNERTCSARPRWQLATPGEKVECFLKRTYHKKVSFKKRICEREPLQEDRCGMICNCQDVEKQIRKGG